MNQKSACYKNFHVTLVTKYTWFLSGLRSFGRLDW